MPAPYTWTDSDGDSMKLEEWEDTAKLPVEDREALLDGAKENDDGPAAIVTRDDAKFIVAWLTDYFELGPGAAGDG